MSERRKQQEKLLSEIKSISKQLSSIETVAGLMMYGEKIQKWYDHYLLVKYLNETSLTKVINDTPEKTPIYEGKAFFSTDIQDRNKIEEIEQQEPLPSKQETPKMDTTIVDHEHITKEPIKEVAPPVYKEEKPQYTTPTISIDLNDKLGFVSQLFNGNTQAYETMIETINMSKTQLESNLIIQGMKEKYNWTDEKDEFVDRLKELNAKRFN